ncbi:MAG: cache domain-containing protein [Elusimicrobia bacterium]|nr:cache domain-containing protein [Elusimicrobiota bacterium]
MLAPLKAGIGIAVMRGGKRHAIGLVSDAQSLLNLRTTCVKLFGIIIFVVFGRLGFKEKVLKIDLNKCKFVAVVTALFLIPFLILSNHFLNSTREIVRKNALERIGLRTKAVSKVVSGVLNSNYEIFRIVKSEKFVKLSNSERKKLLKREMEKHKEIYRGFAVFTPTCEKLFSAGDIGNFNCLDELFKKAVLSAISVGAVEYSEDAPCSLIVAEPIFSDKSENPRLVVFGKTSLASLNNVIRTFGKKSRSELGIVDAGGQIISDSTGRAIIKPGIMVSDEIIKAINFSLKREAQNSSSQILVEDRKILVSVSSVQGTKWWVYEKIDSSSLLDYSFWAKRIVYSGIILIMAFAFISYKLAQIWLIPKKLQVKTEV